MLGAIIGDMVGSIYEFHPIKSKSFNIYDSRMNITDDSVLTLEVAKTIMKHYPMKYDDESIHAFKHDLIIGFINGFTHHPTAGWGGFFYHWCKSYNGKDDPLPYGSYGNGSAMRISPVGWVAKSEEELKLLSKIVSEVTHNHIEGIKGAEAIALSIFMALHNASKEEIKERMIKEYYPEIETFDFDTLVKTYRFNETCPGSVPQAIYCFLISSSLEDAIRNCIAIGGDCDTTAAMAGAIAEAYYQKSSLSEFEKKYLYLMVDPGVERVIKEFHHMIGSEKFKEKE